MFQLRAGLSGGGPGEAGLLVETQPVARAESIGCVMACADDTAVHPIPQNEKNAPFRWWTGMGLSTLCLEVPVAYLHN